MTAPVEPARADVRDWLTEAARIVHIHRGLLEREMFHLSTGPGWRIEQTAREIRDDLTVEHWLARQLRELPGGER